MEGSEKSTSKIDKQLESGKYFITKKERLINEKRRKIEEAAVKSDIKKKEKLKKFQPPECLPDPFNLPKTSETTGLGESSGSFVMFFIILLPCLKEEVFSSAEYMIPSSVDDSKPPLLLSEESSEHDSTELTQCEHEEEGPVPESRKTVMVMPEDIEAAGLSMQNLSELTESQFNALVLIAERRQRASESVVASDLPQREQYDDQIAGTSSAEESITMVITDDGSLKLTDASGQTFSFDGDQLAALRIDVNNLTDESIQQIVQLAMPAINMLHMRNLERRASKMVYQKEPSYIVIRLPACDDCTKERMIVLDERAKRPPLAFCQK
ncbi:unnamed protein product [Nippostrongylus brasiliensis]|uniref:ADD_ATRX domain-containing protein n=1 Tax=Nippostrongylus brasiliensis TaxID=27835 RepID=A0A158QYR0_NIPBR|nr:unnamed protein product [Nippostrongylus brasiliensis]